MEWKVQICYACYFYFLASQFVKFWLLQFTILTKIWNITIVIHCKIYIYFLQKNFKITMLIIVAVFIYYVSSIKQSSFFDRKPQDLWSIKWSWQRAGSGLGSSFNAQSLWWKGGCLLCFSRGGHVREARKQAVVWLVSSRGEGPFILVWSLRFTVLFSLSLLRAAGISFRLTLLFSLAHWRCVMLGAGCPGLRG